MTYVKKTLPSLLLAVILAAVLSLAVGIITAQPTFAAEKKLNKVCFDGDSGYQWAHFYGLSSLDAKLSLNDLNITVLDQNGEVVPADQYELTIQHTWWDEKEQKDKWEDAQEPFGIFDNDRAAGYYWSEYTAVANPVKGSDYGSEAGGVFILVDKHCLSYIGGDVSFEDAWNVEGWRMHTRYFVSPEDLKDPVVRSSTDPTPLTKGTDYDLTYYELTCDPDDFPQDTQMSPDELLEQYSTQISGLPDKEGYFFVKATGKGSYYGECITLFDVGEGVTPIKFEGDDRSPLWSDATKDYHLNIPDGIGGELWIGVGVRGEDDWEILFSDRKDQSDYFVYDSSTQILTLKGDAIYKALEEAGTDSLDLYACLHKEGDFDEIYTEGFSQTQVLGTEYDYHFPEKNNDMLPGWNYWLENRLHLWIRDSEHPDGEEIPLDVTDLKITKQTPKKAGEDVVSLEKDEEGHGWDIWAESFGSADLTMTFRDYDGVESSYDFTVNVCDTVYKVDLWSETGVEHALPGDSITMQAKAVKYYTVPDPDDPEDYGEERTIEGLDYQWSLAYGEEYATVTQDSEFPSKAVVKFNELPPGQEEIWDDVEVTVSVTDKASSDPAAIRAVNDWRLFVESEFCQIWPASIDRDMDIGETVTITPEVRHYKLGEDYDVIKDASFRWEYVDDEAVKIENAGNGTYKITRLMEWPSDFDLVAEWDAPWGKQRADQWYQLDEKELSLEFVDGHDFDVYDDNEITLKTEVKGLGKQAYTMQFTVLRYDDKEDEWVPVEETGFYKVDGQNITFVGADMAKTGLDEVRVEAEALWGDDMSVEDDAMVHLKKSCGSHDWSDRVVKEPTCTEPGLKEYVCKNCGETKTEPIPASGHKFPLTHVEAKKPTLTEEGNIEYWTCSVCHACFLDPEAKTEVKSSEVTLPKLQPNTMTVKANNVTAKAKKKTTIKAKKAFKVSNAVGKVTYKKKKGDKKITISKAGKVTVKKGLKKGKTYKVKVAVTDSGNAEYAKLTREVTLKIKIN